MHCVQCLGRRNHRRKQRPPMPMPWTYRHSSKEFSAFLEDVKEEMSLQSDNSTYTAVEGVLLVFRRRLTCRRTAASVLPSVLRAIFVEDWDIGQPPVPCDRVSLTREAQALRLHHSLTPDNAIEATARALRARSVAGSGPGAGAPTRGGRRSARRGQRSARTGTAHHLRSTCRARAVTHHGSAKRGAISQVKGCLAPQWVSACAMSDASLTEDGKQPTSNPTRRLLDAGDGA